MYHIMSTETCNDKNTSRWVEALADAEGRYTRADKKEKRQWQAVMGTIREAIERGEPWPD
jgi:hypothetical protein